MDVVCFKGIDADNKNVKRYVCAMSISADAVHLAFIDEVQGRPSISHVVLKRYGKENRGEFRARLEQEGHKRFKDFDKYEDMEKEYLESLIPKSLNTAKS